MDNLDEYGLKGAAGLWLLKQGYNLVQAWQNRVWKKEDSAELKTYQLYDQLLKRERDVLPVIVRNSDVLDDVQGGQDDVRAEVAQLRKSNEDNNAELRKALEAEMSQITAALRDLTAQVARKE